MSRTRPRTPPPAAVSAEEAREWPPVTLSEHEGVRYLHLGSEWVQGGMRIRKPQVVEIDYVQRMLAVLLWQPLEHLVQGQAVQLGLGAGALTRFTAVQLKMPTTAVEIHPAVVQVNQSHFHLPAAAEVVLGDAGAWLAQAEPASVRLLFVDLYDEEAAAPVLDSEPFYGACHRVLEEGGLMAVNLFGRQASFHASMQRMAGAFGSEFLWSLRPTRQGNTVAVASRGQALPPRESLLQRAAQLEQRFGALGLAARQWPRMVRPWAGAPAPHAASA